MELSHLALELFAKRDVILENVEVNKIQTKDLWK